MFEKYAKKQAYEFCRLRNLVVRLDVVQSTVTMPDQVSSEIQLVPLDCNQAKECKRRSIRCIVFDKDGEDPCPEAWRNG